MRRPCYDCVLVSVALALMLAIPVGAAFGQDSNKLAATFNERFPADEISTPLVPRSFLNAGTNVLPGERKFLDYAFPPTYAALDVVSNTGGRVGWHHSPLPGPFFPQ